MMEYPSLVRVGTLYPFLKVLQQAGCPVERHLDQCRILRQTQELEPEHLVPLASVLSFLERASRCEGMEDLGLLAGTQTTIYDLGEYGRSILREPTVLKALARAHQSVNRYNMSVREWISPERTNVRLFRHFRVTSMVGLSHADHFGQMVTLNSLRFIDGPGWMPDEVAFQSKVPASFNLESRIGLRVRCSQGADSILMPRSILARRIKPPWQATTTALPQDSVPAPADPIAAIRLVIEAQLFEGYSDIHFSAEAAGMSVRTLQRRLEAEGLSYSKLLDDVRFRMAISLMKDPSAKMIEIALDLGYESPGSFTRAFRRWSGFSPQEFRVSNYEVGPEDPSAPAAIGA